MQPVREIGQGRGRPYGGCRSPDLAKPIYGRGLVQLTWKANYARMAEVCGVDLVADPDLALGLTVAVTILFEGMLQGLFTGKRLADFFHDATADWVEARRIVNGVDRADTIAGFAQHFDVALRSARRTTSVSTIPPPAPPSGFAKRLKSLFGFPT